MKQLLIVCLIALLSVLGYCRTVNADNNSNSSHFTPAQQAQIQSIIHDYLINNPQVLVEAAKALQKQQLAAAEQQAQKAFAENAQQFLISPTTPVAGNLSGSVTLIEFFDYQCPYCKRMAPTIVQMINTNSELRVVFKELPIFGEPSEFAARAALAAVAQGKYIAMHNALMKAAPPLNDDQILAIARSIGLDIEKLKRDMDSPTMNQELNNNLQLANTMGIIGTPAFLIVNAQISGKNTLIKTGKVFFLPGAASKQTLENLINQAQKN